MPKSYFAEYNKKRKPVKMIRKAAKLADQEFGSADIGLITEIADGTLNWVKIEERVANSAPVNSYFEKIGFANDFTDFMTIVIDAGSQFQTYFKELELKTLTTAQKDAVKDDIKKLANGIEVKAKDIEKKLKEIGKKPGTPISDTASEILTVLKDTQKVAHAVQAIHAELNSIEHLSASLSNFNFWLTRHLAKRRLLQDELVHLHELKSSLNVTDIEGVQVNRFLNRFRSPDEAVKKILGTTTLKHTSLKAYRRALQEKIDELITIADKDPAQRNAIEKEKLKNNLELVEFLFSTKTEAGRTLNQTLLTALMMRFEADKITSRIEKNEEWIQHRVIAELKLHEKNQTESDEIKKILSDSVEKEVPALFTAAQHREKAQSFLDFAKNPDLSKFSRDQIQRAIRKSKHHEHSIHEKILKKQTRANAKSLVLISSGFALCASLCAVLSLAFPPAAVVAVPLGIVLSGIAGIIGFAAERVQPGITKEMKKGFFTFRKQIKKQNRIAEKMKKLAGDTSKMDRDASAGRSISFDESKAVDTVLVETFPLTASIGLNFSNPTFLIEETNSFEAYNKKRVVTKESSLPEKIAKSILKEAAPEDAVLLSQLAEGDANWVEIGKRLALNAGAKAGAEKLGIETAYEEFVNVLVDAGSKIQKFIGKLKTKALAKSQQDEILKGISDLSKGVEVKAEDLQKKVDDFGKMPETPITDWVKRAAQVLKAVKQIAYASHALRADVHAYQNATRLKSDVHYWLDRQLVKRNRLLTELKSIDASTAHLNISTTDQNWIGTMSQAELEWVQKSLFGTLVLSEIKEWNIDTYRGNLQEKLNDLVSILGKEKKSEEDLEFLRMNQYLIEHLCVIENKQIKEIKTDVLVAFAAHLEKENVLTRLLINQERIQHRVLAHLKINEPYPDVVEKLEKQLKQSVEKNVPDFISSDGDYKKTRAFIEFANDPALSYLDDFERRRKIDEALRINSEYELKLDQRILNREKRLTAKTLMMVGAGIALVAAALAAAAFAAPVLGLAAIGVAATALIFGFAAERVHRGTLSEMKNGFSHFTKKITKHDALKKEMHALHTKPLSKQEKKPRIKLMDRFKTMFAKFSKKPKPVIDENHPELKKRGKITQSMRNLKNTIAAKTKRWFKFHGKQVEAQHEHKNERKFKP